MRKIVLLCLLVTVQAACAAQRGRSVNQVSANSDSVSFNYKHFYTGERAFTERAAESHCNQFDKHAQLASQSTIGQDRTLVMFDCVDP
jgi:hypothetical protein